MLKLFCLNSGAKVVILFTKDEELLQKCYNFFTHPTVYSFNIRAPYGPKSKNTR